jgi:YMGG-like Gly-zipper
MKNKSIQSMLLAVFLVALISLSGCATPAPQNYLMTGAGLGGAVGAAIGAATNATNPWKGAAIGALLGGATGAVGGEVYRRTPQPAQPQQGYNQYGPQQPGYGYPPPNQGYYRGPNYGPPAYSQSGPPPYNQSGPPAYGQSGPPPGYYSQEGPPPAPYGASQSGGDPSYRYAY